jgi:hypothetical protein
MAGYLMRAALSLLLVTPAKTRWWPIRFTFNVVRFFLGIGCLFLVSGFCRERLGYTAFLQMGLVGVRASFRGLLEFVLRLPGLVDVLIWLVDLLAVLALACGLVWWIKRLPAYLHSITVLSIAAHQGLVVSSNAQLTAILSLPVMIAFALTWTGPESLIALGYCLLVISYLHVGMDHVRLRRAMDRYVAVQTGFASGIAVYGDQADGQDILPDDPNGED